MPMVYTPPALRAALPDRPLRPGEVHYLAPGVKLEDLAEAHGLDPVHVEILAKIFHDQTWMEPPGSDRFDRKPEEWKRPYRVSAAKALTQIDTLAAKVAVIAGERP